LYDSQLRNCKKHVKLTIDRQLILTPSNDFEHIDNGYDANHFTLGRSISFTDINHNMQVTAVHLDIINGSNPIPKLICKVTFNKQMLASFFMLVTQATHED